jgi:4-amino-4-deoxychorismate lyase
MILINGKPHKHLEVSERGFHYGDGLFETLEVFHGRLIFLEQHLQRLVLGCRKLLLPPPELNLLTAEALSLSSSVERGVLKIILTRGKGGRGYQQPDPIQPTRFIGLYPYPNYPLSFQLIGIHARFCQQRLGLTSLAGLKHLNRLEQVLARAEWNHSDIQEGLMLDLNGYVIEGTMSNVFWFKNHTLYTPSLTHSGIAGIMRAFILQSAIELAINVEQGLFTPEQLFTADELFITNSIIGIWPIKRLEQHLFVRGKITQKFQVHLAQFKQQTVNNEN